MQNLIIHSIFWISAMAFATEFFQSWNSLTTPIAISSPSHPQRFTGISDLHPSPSTLFLEKKLSSENLTALLQCLICLLTFQETGSVVSKNEVTHN